MTEKAQNGIPQNPRAGRVPTIAIIGMEGSGKTVLTTTLAKRLSTIDARGVFLNPQGVKTLKYVEGVWHTLQSGDWPPSTPPGELFELQWKFQIVGELECDVRLIDAAGQDLRLLFGDEQINSLEKLPGNLGVLAEYCRSADIILFPINLKDYIGQSNPEQKIANEAAIKSAMDYLGGQGRRRRVCLVLTQTDLYQHLAQERGGWLELAAEAVPYVFSAHVKVRQVTVHAVSAVADTKVAVDPDGTPRRVPVAGFHSEGLDEIVEWLTSQVREVKRELDQEGIAQVPPVRQTASAVNVAPVTSPSENQWKTPAIVLASLAGAALIWIVVGIGCLRGCVPRSNGSPSAQRITYDCSISASPLNFSDDVVIKNTSSVSLTNIQLTVKVVLPDGRQLEPKTLYAPGVKLYPGMEYKWPGAISIPGSKYDANKSSSILACDQMQ